MENVFETFKWILQDSESYPPITSDGGAHNDIGVELVRSKTRADNK